MSPSVIKVLSVRFSRYDARLFIFSQPDKLRMSQVTIRRPFGELDLCDQLASRTEYGRRQPALRFDGWTIQVQLEA